MSRTTISIPSSLLDELMVTIKTKNKTDAVITAIRDKIRMKKQERIKAMTGSLTFTKTADQLEHGDKRRG